MKVLKVILIGFAIVVVVLLIGLTIILKQFDTQRIRLQLTQQLTQSLGRPVGVEDLSLGLSPKGIALTIRGISIADLSEFSNDNFLDVRSIDLSLELMPLLTKHQVLVKNVEIVAPKIHLIRNKDGEMNFPQTKSANAFNQYPSRLGYLAPTVSVDNIDRILNFVVMDLGVRSVEAASTPAANPFLSELLVKSITVSDGNLNFQDKSFSPAISIPVTELKAQAIMFVLTSPLRSSWIVLCGARVII